MTRTRFKLNTAKPKPCPFYKITRIKMCSDFAAFGYKACLSCISLSNHFRSNPREKAKIQKEILEKIKKEKK